jgi:CDP-diacylglycerol--serine O-phosphatidyltransferase
LDEAVIPYFLYGMKNQIPNLLTLFNLLCGSVGVIAALQGDLLGAAFLIRLGACFDFLDGFVARILKVRSTLGKELDSLADVITFGLLPSLIFYKLLSLCTNNVFLPYTGLLLVSCAAWRLARFNADAGSAMSFRGLSTTAYAIFISTLPSIVEHHSSSVGSWLLKPITLFSLLVIGCLLLLSRIPFISLKFSSYSWRKNWPKYSILLAGFILVICCGIEGLAYTMVLYMVGGYPLQYYLEKLEEKYE